jgi:hypothetical protein
MVSDLGEREVRPTMFKVDVEGPDDLLTERMTSRQQYRMALSVR